MPDEEQGGYLVPEPVAREFEWMNAAGVQVAFYYRFCDGHSETHYMRGGERIYPPWETETAHA